jgi:group I intron endonuclease
MATVQGAVSLPQEQGVYAIRHWRSGKRYIGSSQNIAGRCLSHHRALVQGHHCNQYLQAAWNKYGAAQFVFEVIELVSGGTKKLISREQHHMDGTRCYDPKYGYNLALKAQSIVGWLSVKSRQKISDYRCKRWKEEDYKAEQSTAMTARWSNPSKRAAILAGSRSEATRAKKRAGTLARWRDPDKRTAMLIGLHSKESIAKNRNKALARWRDPRRRTTMLANMQSEKARAKFSAISKARWADPVFRAKMLIIRRSRA